MLELGTQMELSFDFQFLFKNIIDPWLIHHASHGVAWSMLERFILKVEFNFIFSILNLHDVEVDLHRTFWNGLNVFRFTELDFVLPDIADIAEEEDLVNIHITPLIYHILYDLFSFGFVHSFNFRFLNYYCFLICFYFIYYLN